MNYVGRFLSSVKTFYSEINPATLTGAIDVIVVQQPDGSLVGSPFHVRFGKMGVLRSREKVVDIQINGEPVDLYMKLGESGEAFFVEELEEEDTVPDYLATSPIPSVNHLFEQGMKELHSESSRHLRSETESSRESEPGDKKASSTDLCRTNSQPLPSDVTIDMQSVEEKLSDIKLESSGKSKEKKLTKTKASMKTLQDVEAGSSQEEDSVSQSNQRFSDGSGQHQISSASVVTEARNGTARSRIRSKKRRKKNVKGGKVEKSQLQSTNTRRKTPTSELSTSSSSAQHSDEEMEGIFPMDDVKDEELDLDGEEDNRPQVNRPVNLLGTEDVTQEVWSRLDKPTSRPFHVFSDGDYTPLVSPQATRPSTPKSDTEADHQRQSNLRQANKAAGADKIEWNWGELPEQLADSKRSSDALATSSTASPSQGGIKGEEKKSIWSKLWSTKNQVQSEGGMYLQDLASEEVDPEVYALYFPDSSSQVPVNRIRAIQEAKDEDKSSDLGNSLPQSPNTVATPVVSDSESHPSTSDSHYSASDLQQGSYHQGSEGTSESLRGMQLSLCGRLKEDEDSIPMEHFNKHLITYEEFCKDPTLLTNPKLVLRMNNKFLNWQMAAPIIISQLAFQKPLPDEGTNTITKEQMPKGKRSLTSWFWGSSAKPSTPKKELSSGGVDDPAQPDYEDRQRAYSMESGTNSADELELPSSPEKLGRLKSMGTERYRKAIRLSSEQLVKLNLQPGPNEIRYSVTTRYQGTSVCESTIYLWSWSDKIIISDIDGTITKSDVFGQILPVLGKDWTHIGVAQLYSNIKQNSYNFLYLSSRAIGQARLTKGYLNSIQQDKASLPDGPLLLNPSSLFQAFHSEVIVRKPEEFKIKCLKDIESLFPPSSQPFYSGFGNRINDTWAYRAVGIPVSRIFTINPQGKVTHEMTKTFQSSYPKMKELVDHVFPPHWRTRMALEAPAEYSSFTYWRNPLPNILPDDKLLKPEQT